MIPLFGVIFWTIFAIFTLWCSACLFFHEKNATLVFPAIIAMSLIFGLGLTEYPTFNWTYLIGYLIGIGVWIPAYWYIDLRRKASEVRKAGGFAKYRKSSSTSEQYRTIERSEKVEGVDKWQIKNPQIEELSSHAIVWPISVPIVLFEDGIRSFVDFMTSIMNRVRDSISNGLDQ